ncbi:hypothetical protein [Halobacillus ihumii]|uniref:hypothetical protein n=1 Tax=Halobacillus ihumii TaxID=2686092 RepID=UPI0013CFA37A|nr:hypothetical protein [Halobacillus ihumii]
MKTCAYCGSEIERNYCFYCQMELESHYILENGKRLANNIQHLPSEQDIFLSTKDLKQRETIELLCLLKYARKHRTEVYNWRFLTNKAHEVEQVEEMKENSYKEYENATRKVWVIENILKERMGYYPKSITEEFINRYYHRIKQSEKKRMIMQKSVVKKNKA